MSGEYVKVLDHGMVKLVGHLGNDLTVVNSPDAKYHEYIRLAVRAGYTPNNEGHIQSPYGTLIEGKTYGKQRYATITLPPSVSGLGKGFGVPIHKLNAYFWYGEPAFSLCVRHLDGNTLNNAKSNLCLGTHSQNEQDKSPEARRKVAKYARSCQPRASYNAKLSALDVEAVRQAYIPYKSKKAPNGFCKALCAQYGVSRTVINKVVKGEHYGK